MTSLRLSHSQQNALHGCSLSWYINRRLKMPGNTYWSTLAGSVAHERIEQKVLTGDYPPESIQEHLDRLVAEQLHNTPYDFEDIRTSKALPPGLKAKDWPDGFRYDSVLAAIPLWLTRWEGWFRGKRIDGWRPWQWPDPEHGGAVIPGAEVHVEQVLGDHPTVGSIDLVLYNTNTGEIALWDYKFGRSRPDNTMQLDAYRTGFKATYGLEAAQAGFYFGRNGKEEVHQYPTYGIGYLHDRYRQAGVLAEQAELGNFQIDRSRCAYLCSVSRFCPVVGGDMAGAVPPLPGQAT